MVYAAGDHVLEVVLGPRLVRVYAYEAGGRALPVDSLRAEVDVRRGGDPQVHTAILRPHPPEEGERMGYLWLNWIPERLTPRATSMTFRIAGLGAEPDTVSLVYMQLSPKVRYVCPEGHLGPEGEADPGTCPTCGGDLERRVLE
jgi:hypothetical protein